MRVNGILPLSLLPFLHPSPPCFPGPDGSDEMSIFLKSLSHSPGLKQGNADGGSGFSFLKLLT